MNALVFDDSLYPVVVPVERPDAADEPRNFRIAGGGEIKTRVFNGCRTQDEAIGLTDDGWGCFGAGHVGFQAIAIAYLLETPIAKSS